MPASFLEIKSLRKSFAPDTSAVNGVSLTVAQGEIICLLGPSGCGKTTLLRMIAGLETPDAGEVIFRGKDVTAVPPHRRGFGMMFQDFALFPHKNVLQNVAFGLEMRGDTPARIQSRVAEMLALVDMADFAARDISQLSGGEQQRVALARALAPNPPLLMLDEPLGALDRALRERLMLELRIILKRVGVTAIYVTHDQTEAFAIADRVAVMNAGQVEQLDTPQTVFSHPGTPFVAKFLGFQNLLAGTVSPAGKIETAIGALATDAPLPAPGTRVTALIRPEAAIFGADGDFSARVTAISFRGKFYQVWVESAGVQLMFELPDARSLRVGATVRFSPVASGVAVVGRNGRGTPAPARRRDWDGAANWSG